MTFVTASEYIPAGSSGKAPAAWCVAAWCVAAWCVAAWCVAVWEEFHRLTQSEATI